MQLKVLAESIPVREILGSLDREIDGIFYDSRRVQKNGLYVAMRGANVDGHQFTEQAVERGAAAIVVERPESHSRATSLVVVQLVMSESRAWKRAWARVASGAAARESAVTSVTWQ